MPKILPKANTIETRWLAQLREMKPGDELFLPASDKQDQRSKLKIFRELLAKLDRDDPVFARSISVKPTYRDHKLWVLLSIAKDDPLVGFIKGANGVVSRIDVEFDEGRERRLKLMWRDGLTLNEMTEALDYPPTAEELRKLKRMKR